MHSGFLVLLGRTETSPQGWTFNCASTVARSNLSVSIFSTQLFTGTLNTFVECSEGTAISTFSYVINLKNIPRKSEKRTAFRMTLGGLDFG